MINDFPVDRHQSSRIDSQDCDVPNQQAVTTDDASVAVEPNRVESPDTLPGVRNAGAGNFIDDLAEQKRLLMMEPDEAKAHHHFPLRPRLLKIKSSMRGEARALIRAKNADELVENFPSPGDSTHAICSGEFVMGDLIDRVRALRGTPKALWIATLSLSLPNVKTLRLAAEAGCDVRVLVSHYFQSAEKELFEAMARELMPAGCQLYVGRIHAKVLLFDFFSEKITITASANLRSSNNIEQVDVFSWPDLFIFHQGWMQEVIHRAEAGINPTHMIKL